MILFLLILSTLTCIGAEQNRFASAQFSADNTRIVYGGNQCYGMVANVTNPNADTLVGNPNKNNRVTAISLTLDNQKVIGGADDGNILIWDANNTQRIHLIKNKFNKSIKHLNVFDETTFIATQTQGKKSPKIVDINTAQTRIKLPKWQDAVHAIQQLDNNTVLLADSHTNSLWDLRTNKIIKTIPNQASITSGIAFNKDTSCIALGKSTNNEGKSIIELWDYRSIQIAGHIIYNGFLLRGIETLTFGKLPNILAFIADNSLMVVNSFNAHEQYRSKLVLTEATLALCSTENSFLIAQETGEIKRVDYQEPA
ncbi:MAG: WD40 repeat domain-containing protein [Candidatus Dependentiae bacterium]